VVFILTIPIASLRRSYFIEDNTKTPNLARFQAQLGDLSSTLDGFTSKDVRRAVGFSVSPLLPYPASLGKSCD
jgi:hypothetical protein